MCNSNDSTWDTQNGLLSIHNDYYFFQVFNVIYYITNRILVDILVNIYVYFYYIDGFIRFENIFDKSGEKEKEQN